MQESLTFSVNYVEKNDSWSFLSLSQTCSLLHNSSREDNSLPGLPPSGPWLPNCNSGMGRVSPCQRGTRASLKFLWRGLLPQLPNKLLEIPWLEWKALMSHLPAHTPRPALIQLDTNFKHWWLPSILLRQEFI
jgi:hypothetical protein